VRASLPGAGALALLLLLQAIGLHHHPGIGQRGKAFGQRIEALELPGQPQPGIGRQRIVGVGAQSEPVERDGGGRKTAGDGHGTRHSCDG
jgi:hypothetical protein